MTPAATKRALAAAAFRRIADIIDEAEFAPYPSGQSPDDILWSLFDGYCGEPFHVVERDPTAQDGTLEWCTICDTEAHDASCPVAVLEALAKVGIDTDTPIPANLGWGA